MLHPIHSHASQPYNMRCLTCGEYIYKGKKFNATQETVLNENYLGARIGDVMMHDHNMRPGLRIYRFYIRCPRCASEICFKTDPKNADYIAEQGTSTCDSYEYP